MLRLQNLGFSNLPKWQRLHGCSKRAAKQQRELTTAQLGCSSAPAGSWASYGGVPLVTPVLQPFLSRALWTSSICFELWMVVQQFPWDAVQ